jgi:hypothetical protein
MDKRALRQKYEKLVSDYTEAASRIKELSPKKSEEYSILARAYKEILTDLNK